MPRARALVGLPALLLPLAALLAPPSAVGGAPAAAAAAADEGCLACHAGIEPMHPEAGLSCTGCHGGDPAATTKETAHVPRPRGLEADERVPPRDEDLAWRRFANPMDLRVAERVCGDCHGDLVAHLLASLHATTAGHLSDGYYEMGLLEERTSPFGVFPVRGAPQPGGAVEALVQPPPFRGRGAEDELAPHFTDLVRKECMQCHLWSRGRAVRGRLGFDGDYRGDGCAACHVPYALDGLSRSGDPTAPRHEPGHPREHALVGAPPTQACAACHYGDASIGLAFRGLSQLPPRAAGGPDVPGTTDRPLNRAFYLDDPSLVPPDVHHERGMHCIDCHTLADVMGDGRLHAKMEHAVEISCEACHGTFDERATLRTERGTPLEHLRIEDGRVVLTSKVDGVEHEVTQVVDVLDPAHPAHEPAALAAMTPEHAELECYACHASWNVNFLGFHFSRNASLSQLDLVSGERTPGRVTTQEKVFATWKSFYAGRNEAGRIAPYMTGFSTMGSVWDEDGELVLDQVLPVTAAGLSGLTMIHHQVHTTRPTARACVECHRSSSTWGLGSPNFRLGRRLAFVADRRGVEVVLLDRGRLDASPPLAKVVLPDVTALAVDADPLQGHARRVFAAEGGAGVHVLDVRDPARPRRVAFAATVAPKGLALAGERLYVADGPGGLRVLDVSDPGRPVEVGRAPTFDAHDVVVQWPYAYVADGPGGLAILDVRDPSAPRLVGGVGLEADARARTRDEAILVRTLFQHSRPVAAGGAPADARTPARHLAAVLDRSDGLVLVDVTEPTRPRLLEGPGGDRTRAGGAGAGRRRLASATWRGLALLSWVDPAEAQGGEPTRERDYAYALAEGRLGNGERRSLAIVLDVTDPERPDGVAAVEAGYATEALVPLHAYAPPFLRRLLLTPGEQGVLVADASDSREPTQAGALPGIRDAWAVAVEEFPLDRMLDEDGRPLKDVSHPGSRWLALEEIERVLAVPADRLGLAGPRRDPPGATARLALANADRDASGALEGDEIDRAGATRLDLDGDGRVTLGELGLGTPALGDADAPSPADLDPAFAAPRVDPDGELARLLDPVDPRAHDRDEDGALDRREATRALFAALDLDHDDRLDADELSRAPGDARELRWGGPGRDALLRRLAGSDGRVSPRELALRDEDWAALDVDGDGEVRLRAYERAAPRAPLQVVEGEWPYRRPDPLPLPPVLDAEALWTRFDADGDRRLTRRELGLRSDLLDALDLDASGVLDEREVQRALERLGRDGVEATPDGFAARWDLDGDGEVEPDEIPAADALRARGVLRR